jgi:thiol-disulfide isomerase/thioredoxin
MSCRCAKDVVEAFSVAPLARYNTRRHSLLNGVPVSRLQPRSWQDWRLDAALVTVEDTAFDHKTSNSASVRSRVKDFLTRRRQQRARDFELVEVDDVDILRYLLGKERGSYTALMFHAKFCTACKASLPLFQKLARKFGKRNAPVKFLSVAVTKENSQMLEDAFGIKKYPMAQIYHPDHGLVDERPILKKAFKHFEEKLRSIAVAKTDV